MSVKVQTEIWRWSKQKGTLLLLMLAIGDFSDDDGMAFPSVRTLATKTKLSERGIQYLIARLERSGELVVEHGAGPRGCNLFRVQILQECNRVAPVQTVQGCKPDAGGVQNPAKRGARAIAPEPSMNHQGTIIQNSNFVVSEAEFIPIWKEYPSRDGRKEALRHFLASVKTVESLDGIRRALVNYKQQRDRENRRRLEHGLARIPWKNGSTWFNNWRDWIPDTSAPVERSLECAGHFCQFCAVEHEWPCNQPDQCDRTREIACPAYIANRKAARAP